MALTLDPYGNSNRNYNRTTGATTSAGTASGRTRGGAVVGTSGRDTRDNAATALHTGAAGGGSWGGAPTIAPPNGYDPAAAASATASSGAAARGAAEAAAAAGQPAPPPPGSESGPGILEDWFNQRVSGVDQAYQYGMKRGGDEIDNRMAAGGSFNSGARGQQLGDFAANMGAQRQSQLDTLAAGASGEHQDRFKTMYDMLYGTGAGQAGVGGAYDLKSADSLNAANQAILSMFLNKAGVDQKSNQQGFSNILGLLGL